MNRLNSKQPATLRTPGIGALYLAVLLFCVGGADIARAAPWQDPFDSGGSDTRGTQQTGQDSANESNLRLDNPLPKIVTKNPAITAIMESKPQSPFDFVRSMDILLNLGRDDLAREFMTRLSAVDLSDQQKYELYKQAGSDVMFRLGNRAGLQPEAGRWAKDVLDGADRYATDSNRISMLVEQTVRESDKYRRSQALTDLRLLGDIGAAALIEKLVNSDYEEFWPRIRQAVRLFDRSAEGPLMAALRSNSLKLRVEATYMMRDLDSSDAADSLLSLLYSANSPAIQQQVAQQSIRKQLGRVPDLTECQSRLYRAARLYLVDQKDGNVNLDQSVKWWKWNADQRAMESTWMSVRSLNRVRALGRASELLDLFPNNVEYQILYWVCKLDSAKLTTNVQLVLPAVMLDRLAESIPQELAPAILRQALDWNRIPAAIAACEVLGAGRQPHFVTRSDGSPSQLVRALNFGNVRLKRAAVNAIFRIDPYDSFAGSTEYVDSLVELARSNGTRSAIVGHQSRETAQTFAALVNQNGFVTSNAITSREFFDLARADSDLQLMLITDKLSRPAYSELVQAVRSSSRLKQVPILLMVDPENLDQANRLADRYDGIQVSPLVANDVVIARQIQNLRSQDTGQDATETERLEYSTTALRQLAHYASQPERYPFVDLVNRQDQLLPGIDVSATAADMCRVLGYLGTERAQTALLRVASSGQLPIDLRTVAASSFKTAVERHGLMLSRQQLLDQYARYNASELESAESRKVLGSLLDAIETPSRASSATIGQ